jgi:Fe2+ transport system protein FeoA
MITIDDLGNGEKFKVIKVVLAKEIGKRLADMGFTHGAEGRVVRSALLGDPLQIRIRGYDVMIRRAEARGVEVARLIGPHRHRHGQNSYKGSSNEG